MFADRINQKIAVSLVFVATLFIATLDTSIVNVAIPTIGREFHASTASVDSVVVGFLVSLAVFIPVSGWLGDRYGNKWVLLAAIVIFTVASILCGAAQSLGQLVAFRILQGVGGGMLAPVGLALLLHAFPPAERIRASTIIIVPSTLAPALGPLLGGLFTEHLSWRWVFYVNVPIGAMAFVFGALFLADPRHDDPGRFDLRGFVLAGLGLSLLMYGISEGPNKGWSDGSVITTCVAGAVALVALVAVELHTPEPMLDLHLYANHLFRSTLTVITLMAVSYYGALYLASLFYQNGLGLSPQASGLNVFPQAVGFALGAPITARKLYPRFGPRRVIASGALVVTAMMGLLATVGPETSLWTIRTIVLGLGLGMSAIGLPAQTASFATVPAPKLGRASTLFNSQQRLGSALGVAAITTIVIAVGTTHVVQGHRVANLIAYRVGFLVAAAIMLLNGVAALVINDADAAETMIIRQSEMAQLPEPQVPDTKPPAPAKAQLIVRKVDD